MEDAAFGLARAGHRQAQQWQQDGRSPVLANGSLDPQFVEEVVQREPDAAATLVAEQAAANVPPAQRLSVGEAVALGVTTQRAEPGALLRDPQAAPETCPNPPPSHLRPSRRSTTRRCSSSSAPGGWERRSRPGRRRSTSFPTPR